MPRILVGRREEHVFCLKVWRCCKTLLTIRSEQEPQRWTSFDLFLFLDLLPLLDVTAAVVLNNTVAVGGVRSRRGTGTVGELPMVAKVYTYSCGLVTQLAKL